MHILKDIVAPSIDRIIETYIKEYLVGDVYLDHENAKRCLDMEMTKQHKAALKSFASGDIENIRADYKKLGETYIELDVPFIIVSHELGYFKNELMRLCVLKKAYSEVMRVCELYEDIENEIADLYLTNYLVNLDHKNLLRLSHLSNLSEKNLMVYFEEHLVWMVKLIEAVKERNVSAFPELDCHLCNFGKWLDTESVHIIRNQSHRKAILDFHGTLHKVAGTISKYLPQKKNAKKIYGLMQKADRFSLEIGSEIAVLNNILIISTYTKDALTGLLTRRVFDTVFFNQIDIAKATENSFSIMMCDLDHFKEVNDTYGHLAGDQVLIQFSAIMKSILRKSDFVFRYGGEEFIVIFPATAYDEAKKITDKIRQKLESMPIAHEGKVINSTASFGVIEVNPLNHAVIDPQTLKNYLQEVDVRLYMAKQNGRNRVE